MSGPKPLKPRFVLRNGDKRRFYWTHSDVPSRVARKQGELHSRFSKEWREIQEAAIKKMAPEKFRRWRGKAFAAWQKKTNRQIAAELEKFELTISGKSEWT